VMVVPQNEVMYKAIVQKVGRTVAPKAFELPYFTSTIDEARELLKKLFALKYP
jgi:hypothetical protein